VDSIDIPVTAEFHADEIRYRDHCNLDTMHRQVLGSEHGVRQDLMGPDLLTAKDQAHAASSFRFAAGKKHVQTCGVAKPESVSFRYFLLATLT
jgi:hypothetical protein